MTLTITLTPEQERAIQERVAASDTAGIHEILASAAMPTARELAIHRARQLSPDEFEESLRAAANLMSQFRGPNAPAVSLPITRDEIYQDHL